MKYVTFMFYEPLISVKCSVQCSLVQYYSITFLQGVFGMRRGAIIFEKNYYKRWYTVRCIQNIFQQIFKTINIFTNMYFYFYFCGGSFLSGTNNIVMVLRLVSHNNTRSIQFIHELS